MKDYNTIATGVLVFFGLMAFAAIILDNYITAGIAMCMPSMLYWGFGIFINVLISKRLDKDRKSVV